MLNIMVKSILIWDGDMRLERKIRSGGTAGKIHKILGLDRCTPNYISERKQR